MPLPAPPRRAVLVPALLLCAALAGCGSGSSTTTAPSAAPAPSAKNPNEPAARAALTLNPRTPPPTTPAPTGAATPWPGLGHDARHSGSAPVTGPQTGAVRWTRTLGGPVVPGPAIGKDGTVYAASNGGVLHALDPATGKDRWRYDGHGSYGSDLSTVPLVLPSGDVLWPGPNDTLYALSSTGKLRWKAAFAAQPLSPARGSDGTVYVNDMAGGLRALSPAGKELWRASFGSGTSYGQTTIAPDGTLIGVVDNTLVGVRNRQVAWRFKIRSMIEVSPAVGPDGTIVVGTNDGNEYGVSAKDGKQLWATPRGSITYSSAAVTNAGVAYFGDHRGALDVLDAASGTVLGRFVGQARTKAVGDVGVWTAPAIDAKGDVYFGTRVGHVYGFAPDGKKLLDVDTGDTVDSYPALGADGTLFIGSESGKLYAIGG